MLRGFTLRWIMLLGVILASVPAVIPTVVAAHSSMSARMRLFVTAGRQSGVPLAVLVGLAWEQSMLSNHHGRPSIDDGYGLLDLSARPAHDTLVEAARLVNAAPSRLRRDDRLNVLGGALLLAREEHQLGYRRLPRSVAAWDRAVIVFTGMRSTFAAGLIIEDMDRALERGIRAGGIYLPPIAPRDAGERWLRQIRSQSNRATETRGPSDSPGAIWEPADYGNYTDAKRPAGHPIRYIVIHDTESSCGAAVNWFQNPAAQASAHYVVCLDGTVIQTVHDRDIAWHAGNWPINEEAIGIEHEGYSDHAYYTRAQYLASAALVRYLCHKYHIDPNRNVIFGHENVPAANHTDPGPDWNWDFYMRKVRKDTSGYAGGITSIAMIIASASIYSCPDPSCSVLGSADWGEQFYISHEQSGWDAIFYGGRAGWVQSGEIEAGSGSVLRTKTAVPVLAGPKAGDQSVGTIPSGETYISLIRDGRFWYISYNHRYGFISAATVKSTSCPAPALDLSHASLCFLDSGSTLSATPNTGMPGTSVTVAGTGIAAGPITVSIGGQTLATGEADSRGTFDITAPVPMGVSPGPATITATGSDSRILQTPFVVEAPAASTAQIVVTPQQPLAGGQIKVSGSGFPRLGTVTIIAVFSTDSGQTRLVRVAPTDPNGNFAAVSLSIPLTAKPGTDTITTSAPGTSASAAVVLQSATGPPVTATPVTVTPVTATPVATQSVPRIRWESFSGRAYCRSCRRSW